MGEREQRAKGKYTENKSVIIEFYFCVEVLWRRHAFWLHPHVSSASRVVIESELARPIPVQTLAIQTSVALLCWGTGKKADKVGVAEDRQVGQGVQRGRFENGVESSHCWCS